MNIQQLEYIVAVDNFRHFAKAAEECRVTQPTLSMMIQKLEDELGVRLFDRSKHPVEPTAIGEQVVTQARISLKHFGQIKELVENEQQVVRGTFRLGIIPTIASYMVPSLLQFQQGSSEIDLVLKEVTTANMLVALQNGTLDGGILAGPLHQPDIDEYPLYYEKFYAYVSPLDEAHNEKDIDLTTINLKDLWLLENEHCLRGQIERLCSLKKKLVVAGNPVKYESGSIETLINVVDCNPGITIIPEMHAMGLSEERQDNLRPFRNTTAVREVCMITGKGYVRKTMLGIIMDYVRNSVPKAMQNPELKKYVVDL